MTLSEAQKGDVTIIAQNILWSLFPVITILSFNRLSPLLSFAWSVGFSLIFFIGLITVKKQWREILKPPGIKDILLATLFTGILYYVLFFFALKYTTAGNTALIGLLETFTSYLLFIVWKKELLPRRHFWGIILMVLGGAIVLFPKAGAFNKGDLLMLAAVAIAPFGNFFQQRARKTASSETIMFFRSVLTFVVILILAMLLGQKASLPELKHSFWFLLINGFIMFGLVKILWIEGIHRISVTKANALAGISPLLTILFGYWFLNQHPQWWQFLAFAPLAIGLVLLTSDKKPQFDP